MQERWSKNLPDGAIESPLAARRPLVLTAENQELSEKMLKQIRLYKCTG